MGGDGQALHNKRSLLQKARLYVKEADPELQGKIEKQTEKERRVERWTHCALSLEPLEFPVAFDLGGHILSKQAVVTRLVERKKLGIADESISSDALEIRKLSEIREVENEMEESKPSIRCAVTGVSAAAGIHKFVGFWGCGHVVVSSSVPDVARETCEAECPLCGEVSCVVPLVVDSEAESGAQQKRLKSLLRATRKRGREQGEE